MATTQVEETLKLWPSSFRFWQAFVPFCICICHNFLSDRELSGCGSGGVVTGGSDWGSVYESRQGLTWGSPPLHTLYFSSTLATYVFLFYCSSVFVFPRTVYRVENGLLRRHNFSLSSAYEAAGPDLRITSLLYLHCICFVFALYLHCITNEYTLRQSSWDCFMHFIR